MSSPMDSKEMFRAVLDLLIFRYGFLPRSEVLDIYSIFAGRGCNFLLLDSVLSSYSIIEDRGIVSEDLPLSVTVPISRLLERLSRLRGSEYTDLFEFLDLDRRASSEDAERRIEQLQERNLQRNSRDAEKPIVGALLATAQRLLVEGDPSRYADHLLRGTTDEQIARCGVGLAIINPSFDWVVASVVSAGVEPSRARALVVEQVRSRGLGIAARLSRLQYIRCPICVSPFATEGVAMPLCRTCATESGQFGGSSATGLPARSETITVVDPNSSGIVAPPASSDAGPCHIVEVGIRQLSLRGQIPSSARNLTYEVCLIQPSPRTHPDDPSLLVWADWLEMQLFVGFSNQNAVARIAYEQVASARQLGTHAWFGVGSIPVEFCLEPGHGPLFRSTALSRSSIAGLAARVVGLRGGIVPYCRWLRTEYAGT